MYHKLQNYLHIQSECVKIDTSFIRMIEITLLASLLTEHNASHWEMSCSEWNQNRIEILSDKNLNSDAHEYLIDYLRTKVSDDCDAYIIGRK